MAAAMARMGYHAPKYECRRLTQALPQTYENTPSAEVGLVWNETANSAITPKNTHHVARSAQNRRHRRTTPLPKKAICINQKTPTRLHGAQVGTPPRGGGGRCLATDFADRVLMTSAVHGITPDRFPVMVTPTGALPAGITAQPLSLRKCRWLIHIVSPLMTL